MVLKDGQIHRPRELETYKHPARYMPPVMTKCLLNEVDKIEVYKSKVGMNKQWIKVINLNSKRDIYIYIYIYPDSRRTPLDVWAPVGLTSCTRDWSD